MTDTGPGHDAAMDEDPPRFADFFDGRRAIARRARVTIDDAARALVISPPEAEDEVWPLDDLRAVPDQADASRLVLTSMGRALARLVLTDAEAIAMVRRRTPRLSARPPVRGKGRILAWAVGAVASVLAIVFLLVPVMADQLARLLPVRGEIALGRATLEQIQTALGDDVFPLRFCRSPEGQAALGRMYDRLSGDGLDLPYEVSISVLDHPMVNAFALPGGQVVFFRGMIDAAEHPDQIAAVLAHEIGHVAARDPTRTALRSAGSIGVLGLLLGDFAGGTAVLFLVERIIEADYSRDAEADADRFATERLVGAGIDPGALGDLFRVLLDRYGDVEGIAAHFASHPELGDRIAASRAASARVTAPRPSLGPEDWAALKRICAP